MAQKFKEVAHLRTDLDKYGENYERIFGIKDANKDKESEPSKEDDFIHNQLIKNKAREAYKEQISQDTEGGCQDSSGCFISGYVAGYKAGLTSK